MIAKTRWLAWEMKGDDVFPTERASRGYERAAYSHGGLPLRGVLGGDGAPARGGGSSDGAMELHTYECDACGHSQTYSLTALTADGR